MNILVLGKPKTGTTVISKTILKSLDGETEYVFEPNSEAPFQQDYGDKSVVAKVLFDHWKGRTNDLMGCIDNRHALSFDKRVIIQRDPRDEAISYLMYYPFTIKAHVQNKDDFSVWIDFLHEKERAPESISFLAMCRKFDALFNVNFTASISKLNTLDGGYTRFRQQVSASHMVFRYEDFVSGKTTALAKYLGVELSSDRDVGGKYSQTYRSGSFNNWKRYFTPEDVSFFEKHAEYLKMLGYEDWELTPPRSIPEQELSGYVARLLQD